MPTSTSTKRNLNLITTYAIVGDGGSPASVLDNTQPNHVWVQPSMANGGFGPAVSALFPDVPMTLNAGDPVQLGWSRDRKLQIKGFHVGAAGVAGTPIQAPSTPQSASGGYLAQDSLLTALVLPEQTPDLTVIVEPWPVVVDGTFYLFPGTPSGGYDLSASVPSSGNECYALLSLDSDFVTLSVTTSTPKLETDFPSLDGTIDGDTIQECLTAAPSGSIPLALIRLYGGQTAINQADIVLDMRQIINVSSGGSAAITVTDGSTTVVGVTTLKFTSGATVSNGGSGEADVVVTGGGGGTSVLLDYSASTDIANGTSCGRDAWTDISTNQSFTVTDDTKVIAVSVTGIITVGTANAACGSRLVIDSGGTPVYVKLGGCTASSTYGNVLSGAGWVQLPGLSNGAHTVKIQVWSGGATSSAYCRASSVPNSESLRILVMQQ